MDGELWTLAPMRIIFQQRGIVDLSGNAMEQFEDHAQPLVADLRRF